MNWGLPAARLTVLGSVGTKSVLIAAAGCACVSGVAGAGELGPQADIAMATNKSIARILAIASPPLIRELVFLIDESFKTRTFRSAWIDKSKPFSRLFRGICQSRESNFV